jgi:phage terminase small subunit
MPTKKTEQGGGKAATTKAAAKSPRKSTPKVNKVASENGKVSDSSTQYPESVKSGQKVPGLAPLTPKQQLFVDQYLIDLNAKQAAIRAGYSEKTAAVIASENLSKPNIAAAIQAAREKTAAKLEVTRERVLAEYAKMAFVDPRQFYNADGSLKNVPELDENTAAALVGIEVDEIRLGEDGPPIGQTKKIKWSDKRAALDSINRMMGWNQDKLKLQGDENEPIRAVVTRVVMVPAKEKAVVETRPLDKQAGED